MDLGLAALVAATLTSGLLAGTFLLYAHTVMPALRVAEDADFVRTFARLDRAIVNPVFMVTAFLGAPLLTGLAAALIDDATSRGWALGALAALIVVVVETAVVHLPRNNALKAADQDGSDPATARAAFDEARWQRWNLVRVLLTVAASAALAWSLVEAGNLN